MFPSATSSPLVCLGWTLIHSVWQGAFIWALYHLVRSSVRDAAIRVHVGHIALSIFVVAQCMTFAHLMMAGSLTIAPIDSVTFETLAEADADARMLPLPRLGVADRVGTWIARHESYLPLVAKLWAIGLAVQVLRTVIAYGLLQRHLNRCRDLDEDVRTWFDGLVGRIGLRRAIRFLQSNLLSTPATARWLKPVVLVPASTLTQLQPDYLEALIFHELAHIKRWDYATNILRTFVSALYFFNPFLLAIGRRTADDAEVAADVLASSVFGDEKTYAEALVALAELRSLQPLLIEANGGNLKQRIRRLILKQSLPATTVKTRASVAGTLLSGAVGLLVLVSATAWASGSRATMYRLTHRSFEEIVVESLSKQTPSQAFLMPLKQAIEECNEQGTLSQASANGLTDALLGGVDPHVVYGMICQLPGRVEFDVFRANAFGPFGTAGDREEIVSELTRHAEVDPDPERGARYARAALVFSSLMWPADSGWVASRLLRDVKFIRLLHLSSHDYRLLQLMAAVNNDRKFRMGEIMRSARGQRDGATDAEVEAFAAELPYLPAFQITLCSRMSKRFQTRVRAVLERDVQKYPPGSVEFALKHAARESAATTRTVRK